ncbi:Uu.00g034910.m01.CDS01 [Anthostomella pinea]|uniref:non-specific serine/threonine protein kinase n=1 Tax=Anthostomella pinea TaxID=933095 RepID=A0AAI8V984_9PEZI|nr:Uu.00g034910.m01.CDS01 [Anthostomella pinea]
MDDSHKLLELQRRLALAEERAEEAERQQQEERRRAEEAERHQEEERRRAEEAEEQTRNTTLNEYIAASHHLVFGHFTIETNTDRTSKGSITNPRNKLCPTNLRPWSDFLDHQRTTLGILYNTFLTNERRFESRSVLYGLGQRISNRRISNEKALEYFLHTSVEDPVRLVVDQLKAVEEVRRAFGIGDGIVFENHPNALSDIADEVRQAATTLPQTPDQGRGPSQIRPGQICVHRSDERPQERTMPYVSEYKAPHKLTAPHLRVGLRPMDIYKEVVNRKTIPTAADPEGRFQYHSERLTASALTQTYHYMIEGGLEYGLLTTGEAIVFLKVDWQDPETLYYHLAEPGPEVADHPTDFHSCTAVGEARTHRQNEREQAIRGLKRWAEDFETTLRSIPKDERLLPTGSSYAPETYASVSRSPHLLRDKPNRRRVERDGRVDQPRPRDQRESSDDESQPRMPETPTPTEPRRGQGPQGQGQVTRRSRQNLARRPRGGGEQARGYCTQLCLLGMVRGAPLDKQCPNAALHQRGAPRNYHPIKHADFLRILRDQLKTSLDEGVTKLGLGGSRGVLFQVTLLAYGYTFVSKGTVAAFIPDLEHEAAVYKHLEQMQGTTVPISLGAVDLRNMGKVYYYDHRVYIEYMMFLSWGGNTIDSSVSVDEVHQCLRSIHEQGVVHGDVRWANVLFNPATDGVMMIDFERASIVKPPRSPLSQVVLNKRPWDHGKDKEKKSMMPFNSNQVGFQDDILAVNTAFSGCAGYSCKFLKT